MGTIRGMMRWRRRRERGLVSVRCEWFVIHDPATARRLAELDRYYGPLGDCEGMGV